MSEVNAIVRRRKSVYPMQYIDKPIPKEILQELLINANHAPTHKRTEPWRFKVFLGEGKQRLGEFLAQKYEELTPDFSSEKSNKIRTKCQRSGALLAIVLHRDPKEGVPEWEELASVACAVQNLWISLDQYGIGGYWSTPASCEFLGEHVPLLDNERCVGFFYMGYHESQAPIMPKQPIENKTEWIES